MLINKNTQLGLLIADKLSGETSATLKQVELSGLSRSQLNAQRIINNKRIALLKNDVGKLEIRQAFNEDMIKSVQATITCNQQVTAETVFGRVEKLAKFDIFDCEKPTYYLITDPVKQLARLIKIKDGFSYKLLEKLNEGLYCYLMGKDEMIMFNHVSGAMQCYYWNRPNKHAFSFNYDLKEDDGAIIDYENNKGKFEYILQLLTFIVLADIEVVELRGGKNNGKTAKEGKVMNQSEHTVYVVDSSWNKLIIRTDGFAVTGHFRLQPCGIGHADRKLIWIDAFEKHGYTRKPRASIID